MADFVSLSDTDETAVDELISQIEDLSVIEQVSRINTSSFTDSLIPPHLETRFQKLKSFPLSNNSSLHGNTVSDFQAESFSPNKHNPDDHKFSSDHVSVEEEENPDGEKGLIKEKKYNLKYGSSGSSDSSMDSPSPPHKSGCFRCSPKKKEVPKNKKNEKWNVDWGDTDDVLSSFSIREQEKILNKAMKEEEKINREAEKIVKWVKQASNRLSFHAIEDEFSDDDKPNF